MTDFLLCVVENDGIMRCFDFVEKEKHTVNLSRTVSPMGTCWVFTMGLSNWNHV